MKNGKAANARYIGPMTQAVAQELRAELARQKRSAKSLAEDNGLNRSTLHKTLNAQRAIDVDDLLRLADLLKVSAVDLFSRAERIAKDTIPNVFFAEHPSDGFQATDRADGGEPRPEGGQLLAGRFPQHDVPAPVHDERAVAKKKSRDRGGDDGQG